MSCETLRGADVTVWDSDPGSRENHLTRAREFWLPTGAR